MENCKAVPKNDAVGKVTRIMEALVDSDVTVSIRDLAARTEIPRSTVHRFLTSLECSGWVVQDSVNGGYRPGMRFFMLSRSPDVFEELVRCARPSMIDLMENTGKTAILSVMDGNRGLCVHTEEPSEAIKFVAHKGMNIPLERSATGFVLLAYCSSERRERVFSSLCGKHGSAEVENLRKRIREVQNCGFAHSREEWVPHAEDLSVPVFDSRGGFIAQLGIAGLSGTFDKINEKLLPGLRKAADRISRETGVSR